MLDIFDVIQNDDIFDSVEQEETTIDRLRSEMLATLEKFDSKERKTENRRLSDEMKDFIRAEIAKIKPTQNVIERVIEKQVVKNIQVPVHVEPKIVEAPPQIIREVRVEVQVEKKDPTKYAKEDDVEALKERIAGLVKQLAETRRMAESPLVVGGSGVIGIPPPEGNDGKVLTVVNRKAVWSEPSGSASSDAYTPTNVTTDRSFDANDTSLDEIADVLGSLIASLQGAGVIQ